MKKYFYKTLVSVLIVLIGIVAINYYMDSYGIFRKKYTNRRTPINERYLKTKYILENKEKYNSFIFGSSRVGVLKGEKLKNGKFYNMTFSLALPKEILEILRLFEKNSVKIENIVLGINDFDIYINPENQETILYKISYKSLNKSPFKIYENYLLMNPFNKISYEYFFGKSISNYDLLGSGKWDYSFKNQEIESNSKKHEEDKKFMIPSSDLNNKSRLLETIEEIKEIIGLCQKNNINLTVIFLPLHKVTYENNNLKNLNLFKEKLLEITNYWDFAEMNRFTENNYYWYETSHFRPMLGDLILKKVFKDDFEFTPELVDKENVFGKFKKIKK